MTNVDSQLPGQQFQANEMAKTIQGEKGKIHFEKESALKPYCFSSYR